ncbi:MAG: hypothetical protein A2Y45_05990 [Tenericutes bacterium GWC2_34_14]|nr:MAG: hypothetical protein A2Z84_04235 [Tenericutes bacterium GWA2_35_7]OHE28505.1 MAG: hypothetical protein A2Y45_05990 [Tenericutes bacterium GWC2_34_14]OHE33587.1 MAG: hypothetical protein A2012_03820 [Tenericutes bacterium GWE2_34_108]OHE36872.1 MAG: hypothetical protein A2Y46_09620 [Tenericutes bacterium GWF1_35_14]OHE38048.1 MAG: hypothetical protein A2Y44_09045 [Tenericutes bacterium GWF2_35_184]OHE43435.1 MAG: hypothetical protein A2221_06690 [Tenericutes bacterium RIFOXYA2_FULL_36_3
MKEIQIPKAFQPFLGEKITVNALILVVVFSLGMTLLTLYIAKPLFEALPVLNQVLLILIMIDVYGGIVANFFPSVKAYYDLHPFMKKVFVFLHVHPFIIIWLSGLEFRIAFILYAVIIGSHVLVRLMKKRNHQELLAIFFNLLAAVLIYDTLQPIPAYLSLLLFALFVKLIYGFSVDLIPQKKDEVL